MHDADFESYLDLLSRFLRLNRRQREDIGRELRAHLEDAIEDEMAGGVSRPQALRHVLDDFGDAAELAARFSKLERRRRWLMQGTVVAACIGFLVLAINIFSPDATVPVGVALATAQAGDEQIGAAETPDQEIRQALQTRIGEVTFQEAPLDQVLEWLNEFMQVNLHVQWRRLEDIGIERGTPIDMNLRDVSAECVLRLVVDEFPEVDVDYEILDNVLIISSREALQRRATTRVYDVRDVLRAIAAEVVPAPGYRTTGMVGDAASPSGAMGTSGSGEGSIFRGSGSGLPGGGGFVATAAYQESPEQRAVNEFTELLTNAVAPDTWQSNGGVGYVQILNGMLVVRQYEGVHADIRQLLADVRAVAAELE